MHKALPGSFGNWHSMNDSPQGLYSGRCVYKSLSNAKTRAHKQVYVLASHSHFYMDDVYDTDFWKTKIGPRIPDLLDREKMVVTRIVPTTRSTAQ